MNQIQKQAYHFRNWLNQPQKVFIASLIVLVISLFLNGTLWKVWGLYRDQEMIAQQIRLSNNEIKEFEVKIRQAKDATFIEHMAREKMDLVGENDLVFVFPE